MLNTLYFARATSRQQPNSVLARRLLSRYSRYSLVRAEPGIRGITER